MQDPFLRDLLQDWNQELETLKSILISQLEGEAIVPFLASLYTALRQTLFSEIRKCSNFLEKTIMEQPFAACLEDQQRAIKFQKKEPQEIRLHFVRAVEALMRCYNLTLGELLHRGLEI